MLKDDWRLVCGYAPRVGHVHMGCVDMPHSVMWTCPTLALDTMKTNDTQNTNRNNILINMIKCTKYSTNKNILTV